MGKGRSLVLFLFAVLVAIAAAWMANNWLQTQIVDPPAPPTVEVVTLTRPIEADERISADDVQLTSAHEHLVPASALRDPDLIIGQFARHAMYPGEVLFAERFTTEIDPEDQVDSEDSQVPVVILPEMPPAMTRTIEKRVRVNRIVGTDFVLESGSRVDVLVTRKAANLSERGSIQTVVQDVEITGVHHAAAAIHGLPQLVAQAVDLAVTRQQAELLDLIHDDWHTILSLRPYRRVVLQVERVGLPLERGMRIDVVAAPRQGRNVDDVPVRQNIRDHRLRAVQAQTMVQDVKIVEVYEQNIRPAPGDAALVTVRYVALEVNPYQARLLASLHDADEWQVTVSLRH